MHEEVREFFEIECLAACAYVALAIPVKFCDSSDGYHEHIGPYIEFSILVEKQICDVLLDYVCVF
jgi:hypothetical protein